MKSAILVVATLIIGVGFLVFLINNKNNQIYQNVKLPIQVDEYFDFNCPHCAEFEPAIKDVKKTYGDKVNITYHEFPLTDLFGATSQTYAQAYEAAKLQNKGDEYHDELFKWVNFPKETNAAFDYSDKEKSLFTGKDVDVVELAKFLNLDVKKFQKDIDSDQVKASVKAQRDQGATLGVSGTPTVYVFGQLLNMQTYGDLKTKVGDLIQTAEAKK